MALLTNPKEVRRLVGPKEDYGSDMMDLLAWALETLFTEPPASDLVSSALRDGSAFRA